MLSDRVVAVLAADDAAGRALAEGLADLGATTSHAGPDAALHGAIDGVVIAPFSVGAGSAVVDVDETTWRDTCESVIKTALASAQIAFAALKTRGGRLVFVVPTEGMTGGSGEVARATAAEAIRSLAKSAARAWGHEGITVNCVAVPWLVLAGERPVAPPAGWALERPPAWTDIAATVALFLTNQSGFVTGTTVCVDGGEVMTP